MRRSTRSACASLLALALAVLAVCPCGPAMLVTVADAAESAHGCCPPAAEGISADSAGCCDEEAPTRAARTSATTTAWAAQYVATLTLPSAPEAVTAPSCGAPRPLRAAPLILRI